MAHDAERLRIEERYPDTGPSDLHAMAERIVLRSGLDQGRLPELEQLLTVWVGDAELMVDFRFMGSESFWPWDGTRSGLLAVLNREADLLAQSIEEERRQFGATEWDRPPAP